MIELRNIVKRFNNGTASETIAIDHLNLTLQEGDFITVIGGNGAGKSTLMNIIAGSIPADEGMVLLDSEDVSRVPEYKRAQFFGRVFQDPMVGTAADMTVIENLALAYGRGRPRSLFRWSYRKEDVEFFANELKSLDLGLEERMYQKVGLLSGGQRQALTLLMATIRHAPAPNRIKKDYVRFSPYNKKTFSKMKHILLKEIKVDFKNKKKEILSNGTLTAEEKNNRISEIKKSNSLKIEAFVDKYDYSKKINEIFARIVNDYNLKRKEILSDKSFSKEERKFKIKEAKHERSNAFISYDVTKPVLLLDEHTAALDPKTAEKVLQTTEKIVNEQKLTTIMITHNMKDAIRFGNRLIMMSKGKIVADIAGEEKKKLTIESLLEMFVTNSKNDILADSAILGD